MKNVMLFSNSPSDSTGFGRVGRELASRWFKRGIRTIYYSISHVGSPHLMRTLDGKEFFIVSMEDSMHHFSQLDVLKMYFDKYKCEKLVTIHDPFSWGLVECVPVFGPRWIPYWPVDGPVTPKILDVVYGVENVVVPSRWGQQEFEQHGQHATYIPHGIDTATFYPRPSERLSFRKLLKIPEDAFVAGWLGTNHADRKHPDKMIEAFAAFLKGTGAKDAYLYMHTTQQPDMGKGAGYDLPDLVAQYEVKDRVIFAPALDLPDDRLAMMYSMLDVFCVTSGGEGFGLPIIEAQACGTPCIVPRLSAMTELVEGHGMVIPCSASYHSWTYIAQTKWGLVDVDKYATALEELYKNPTIRRDMGLAARDTITESYDWDTVVKPWYPLLGVE